MKYTIKVKNLKLVNIKSLVATMSICINDEIEINNCKLVYAEKAKSYKLFYPSTEFTSSKTKQQAYFPLVKLSSALQAKILVEAIEAYEEEKETETEAEAEASNNS